MVHQCVEWSDFYSKSGLRCYRNVCVCVCVILLLIREWMIMNTKKQLVVCACAPPWPIATHHIISSFCSWSSWESHTNHIYFPVGHYYHCQSLCCTHTQRERENLWQQVLLQKKDCSKISHKDESDIIKGRLLPKSESLQKSGPLKKLVTPIKLVATKSWSHQQSLLQQDLMMIHHWTMCGDEHVT